MDYCSSSLSRRHSSTDYAKSQGCCTNKSSNYSGNCWWWLRSPCNNVEDCVFSIDYDGTIDSGYYVYYTSGGVVPALWIKL